MTMDEEVAMLKKQVAELDIRVLGVETVAEILKNALLAQGDRLDRDEHWLADVSAIARHLLDHSMEKTKAAIEELTPAPASVPTKDTQRGIEVG